jgi:hypothetical protein
MDDTRIRELTEEVLREIRLPAAGEPHETGLAQRVAALEARVAELCGDASRATSATVVRTEIPALRLVDVAGGGAAGECSLEPDRPCVGSGRCRTFGH